jgi:hypothetical protein
MKKPINFDKLNGRKILTLGRNDTLYVVLMTLLDGTDTESISHLFLNVFEIYHDDKQLYGQMTVNTQLVSSIAQILQTDDKNYTFTEAIINQIDGYKDWEELRCLILKIDWTRRVVTPIVSDLGDGIKQSNDIPAQREMIFGLQSADSMDKFIKYIITDIWEREFRQSSNFINFKNVLKVSLADLQKTQKAFAFKQQT